MSKQSDYSKHLRIFYLLKKIGINRLNLGMTLQFFSSSSINGSDEMLRYELSSLSSIRLIRYGAPS